MICLPSATEIVLATLVSHYEFELSETPIVWNFGGIAYPSTSQGSSKAEMIMKVSLASR